MLCGLDILATKPTIAKNWGRCALVSNQASVTLDYKPAWQVMHGALGERLVAFMGPQHGMESSVQDNMIETGHARHLHTGLPVYSLYSETREPTSDMLANVDTIVFDLQITGCRIYTYKYTLAGCLRAAKKFGKRVVILDRHNPLGGCKVEGSVLEANTRSFVGEFPIPMRHGLTMGEAGQLFNHSIGADLEVIELEGWDPERLWGQYDRNWVLTSPNLPILDSVFTFPGLVLFEGTNVSEGRGTCLPFLFIGAPFFRSGAELIEHLNLAYGREAEGVVIREAGFQPGFSKWSGELCNGIQVHVTQPEQTRPYRLGLALIRACFTAGEGGFAWRNGPYEYNYDLLPIELLMGSKSLPKKLMADQFDIDQPEWHSGAARYIEDVQPHLLYARKMRLNG